MWDVCDGDLPLARITCELRANVTEAYSAAQDFLLVLLPCVIILRLKSIKTAEKMAIALSMSLGILYVLNSVSGRTTYLSTSTCSYQHDPSAGITAIVKCTYLVTLSDETDRFYALPPLFMWAAGEDALAISAATIPTLRPLLPGKSAHDSRVKIYPLQIFDKANVDAFDPEKYLAEVNTTIEARSGKSIPGDETVGSSQGLVSQPLKGGDIGEDP